MTWLAIVSHLQHFYREGTTCTQLFDDWIDSLLYLRSRHSSARECPMKDTAKLLAFLCSSLFWDPGVSPILIPGHTAIE